MECMGMENQTWGIMRMSLTSSGIPCFGPVKASTARSWKVEVTPGKDNQLTYSWQLEVKPVGNK